MRGFILIACSFLAFTAFTETALAQKESAYDRIMKPYEGEYPGAFLRPVRHYGLPE